jgi:hypothetical protein
LEGSVVTQLEYGLGVCLEGLSGVTKTVSHDYQYLNWDSKPRAFANNCRASPPGKPVLSADRRAVMAMREINEAIMRPKYKN